MVLLLFYRLLAVPMTPLVGLALAYRLLQGKEDWRRVWERVGLSRVPRPGGRLVWLHSASVGELVSLLPLLEQLRDRAGSHTHLLVTTVTRTSAQLAASRLPAGVIHQYAPLDHWLSMLLFRRHWRPDLGVLAEAELWPELIHAMPHALLINARMSARSFRRHRRWPWLTASLLPRFCHCFAQSRLDAERFRALGALGVQNLGSTKLDAPPLPVDPWILQRVWQAFAGRPVLLLASSHPGEEAPLLAAYPSLCHRIPGLALLLVPRHPQRGDEVRALCHGLRVARWSDVALREQGDGDDQLGLDVLVGDVIGAMGSWIVASRLVLIGGSFRAGDRLVGGHNPLEPLRLGRQVLCGPDMANFAELTEGLATSGWLQQCPSLDSLWERVGSHPAWQALPVGSPPFPEGPSRFIATTILAEIGG